MATRKTPKDPNAPKKWPTSDYETGYARPPKHGQIKPGEVRNRWGPKGKPKPVEIDPFEHAAAQLTTVTLNGEQLTMTAEAAAHIVAMQQAMAGNTRAHKNMQDERRSRRRSGPPPLTADELVQQQKDEEKKKELSAEIVRGMALYCSMYKQGLLIKRDRGLHYAPWLEEAMADYRAKHGKSPRPLPGEDWNPHPVKPPGRDDMVRS